MDKPPFSLAFIMVKESFAGPAILFYLASNANKNKHQDHLNPDNRCSNLYVGIINKITDINPDNRCKPR